MFRITEDYDGAQTLIIMDGHLLGEYALLAENYCTQALTSGKSISIVLRDVSVIDDAARNMLRRFARRGVRLHGTGLYTSHLVNALQQVDGCAGHLSTPRRRPGPE